MGRNGLRDGGGGPSGTTPVSKVWGLSVKVWPYNKIHLYPNLIGARTDFRRDLVSAYLLEENWDSQ